MNVAGNARCHHPKRPLSHRIGRAVIYLLLAAGMLVCLFPLAWMLCTALKDYKETLIIPQSFLPKAWKWSNFPEALRAFPFWKYLRNTLFLVVAETVGGVFANTLTGYAFSRLRWPGREFFFKIMLATMMLPGVVTMVPTYILYHKFGWFNTYWPFIIPPLTAPGASAFLMRQFLRTIPMDMTESARIDGAGEFRIYWQITMPLCVPIIVTMAVMSFGMVWNDYLGPLLYLNSDDMYTLNYGLALFRGKDNTDWPHLMAASLVVAAPTVLLFFFAQSAFVEGITLTGVKG